MEFREACIAVKQKYKDDAADGKTTRVCILQSQDGQFFLKDGLAKVGAMIESATVVTVVGRKGKKIQGKWLY